MNKISLINQLTAAIGLAAISSLCQAAASQAEQSVRVVVTAGLTAGGDTIAKVKYSNGDSVNINGGGLVQLGAGVQFHPPGKPFSVLATLNYHVDNATARNGSARFDRVPLELLGFYHFNDRWHLGGGWRHTLNPKFTADFDNQPSLTVNYKDADSLVLQLGFGTARFWGGLRYVNESYKVESIRGAIPSGTYTYKDDGSHFGLLGYFAF